MRPLSHHLDFVRQLSCVMCGDNTSTEAAHIRFADPRAAKPITGIGTKPADDWVVPLCGACHRSQHTENEREWWSCRHIDPIFVAMALSRVSGDHAAGCQIVESARK